MERSLDLTDTGGLLTLLNGYQTPKAIRRTGRVRLETWLRNRRVVRPDRVAATAAQAAGRRHTSPLGERPAAQISRHASGTVTPFK
ncbi:hypothetical protein [Streptomyces mirabilis]|uniref:hypothetical protein n=1 Tax=Streptomyces mirabilis TaxID=68239 RepID=UPI003318DD10